MLHQRRTGFRPASNDVQRARREPGFESQFAEAQRGQGCLLRRLQDHAVAAGQRRSQLPTGQQEREVPGYDGAHHSDRLTQGVGERIVEGVDGLAVNLGGPSGVVAKHVGHHGHIDVARFKDRFAVVECLQLGQLVDILLDQVGDSPQDLASFAGGQLPPRSSEVVKRLAGRGDGLVDVVRAGFGDLGQNLAGGGVDSVEGFA